MDTIFYLVIVVFLAGFVQGFSGFGSVLLALPLLALFMDVKTAIPLMALAGLPLTVFLMIPLWKHLDWRKISPLAIGSLAGVPCGVFLLRTLPSTVIMIVIGVILLLYGLYGLLINPVTLAPNKGWGYAFGFLSGSLGGGFSTPGPPAIIYASLQTWSPDEIKVTLQGYFFIVGILIVALQAVSGAITANVIRYFLVAIIPITAGTYAGNAFGGKLPESVYRRVVFLLLALMGIISIGKVL